MKTKVCHIITKLELGGAQQNTLYTISHLDGKGFEPILICGTGGVLDEEARKLDDIRIYFIPSLVRSIHPLNDLRALLALRSILRRENPEIVHTHSSKAGILGRWSAFLCGVPVILHTIHGFGFHSEQPALKQRLFIMLEKITSKITTRFIAVSKENIGTGRTYGIIREGQAELIRSGIKLKDFSSATEEDGYEFRRKEGIPPGAPLVGMVGCFKPQKAPVDFVRIAAAVHLQVPDVYFIAAGDGELRKEVENEIRKHSLKERVLLLGWRRDIPALMRAIDLLVLPSLWEGLPRVIPEAIASGKPVVATAIDGAKDIIKDGENGFLVEPHDIETFSSRIIFLLKEKSFAEKLSRDARSVLPEFDIDKMVKMQEQLYRKLLARSIHSHSAQC